MTGWVVLAVTGFEFLFAWGADVKLRGWMHCQAKAGRDGVLILMVNDVWGNLVPRTCN